MAAMSLPVATVPVVSILGIYVIYRVVDWVIRWPRVGRYSERYVLVTGSGRGFGFRSCVQLDKLGCHVIAGCHSDIGQEELKLACSERLKVIRLDVSNPESVREAYKMVKSILPPEKGLWGLVNNAGIGGKRGRIEWMSVSDYRSVNDVNLYGLIDVTVTFLPLIKREKGRIVNVTSMGGRISTPEMAPYCISKYAVEAFSDALRRALIPFGCCVSIVEPSGYRTAINSKESLDKWTNDAWNEAPAEARTEFGDAYFQQLLKAVHGVKVVEGEESLAEVTNCYEDALFCRRPRARYIPNRRAKRILGIVPNLPEWASDWVIVKGMGRTGDVLPACLERQRPEDQKKKQ